MGRGVRCCRAPGAPAALGALDPGLPHQPRYPAPADLLAGPLQCDPHPPVAVGAVVGLVDLGDATGQALVLERACRALALGALVVGGGRHLQGLADRLDPEVLAVLLDIGAHFVRRGSSSAAKKADADFRMSLARRSSRTSPRRDFSSSRSAVLSKSLRTPASASALRTHLRRVSWWIRGRGLRGRWGGRSRRPSGHRDRAAHRGISSVVAWLGSSLRPGRNPGFWVSVKPGLAQRGPESRAGESRHRPKLAQRSDEPT